VRLIVVTKTTNLELFGAQLAAAGAEGESMARLREAHVEHHETLRDLLARLRAAGLEHRVVNREEPDGWADGGAYDAVVTVGGDGTVLAANRVLPRGGLVLGVRSSAYSVGYLCCAGPDRLGDLVAALAARRVSPVRAARLDAEVTRADGRREVLGPALNEFLFASAHPAATARYVLTDGRQQEAQRSSGVWIATATGSTAAILAAGGQRAEPSDARGQYRVRELYAIEGPEAPKLSGAFFDPTTSPLVLESRAAASILAQDGQHGTLELGYGDSVRFVAAAPLSLVRSL
jgi:NAD+ kinase